LQTLAGCNFFHRRDILHTCSASPILF
jgi:hypothetical protein